METSQGINLLRTRRSAARKLPERVLVVEDDALLALSLEDALREAGVNDVIVCPTLDLAMASLEAAPPDAIVLDNHLDDRRDGWALAELVSIVGPNHPHIVFSTAAPEEIPDEIAQLGPVLEKPYDPSLLVDALRHGNGGALLSRWRGALHV